MDDESAPDAAYRWTVRLMYGFLLGAELYMIYDAYFKDRPKVVELRARLAARRQQMQAAMSGCEGCARRKEWIRDRAHMFWQAEDIVARSAEQEGTAE